MKLLLVGVGIGFFVFLPLYALNNLLLPEVQGLKALYSSAEETANQISNQAATPNQ